MTKTMEPFLDGRNITMTPHSMDGFNDDLMTPVIDPLPFTKDKETACQWIDSSQNNLSTHVENGFIASFDDSPISYITCLNSPPESVQSHMSNEDSNCATNNFLHGDTLQSERSYNFVDALTEPMKNSQDLLYPGALGFHDEIEQVSNEQMWDIANVNIDIVKTEPDLLNDDSMEPILGNDLMLGQKTGFKFSQQQIAKINTINNNTNSVTKMVTLPDLNMNSIVMHTAQRPKLLAKRNRSLPKLQVTIKMTPIENGKTSSMDDKGPINNNNNSMDVNTPLLCESVLDMERDLLDSKIDLITYIDSDNYKTPTRNMIGFNNIKEHKHVEETVSIPNIEQILPTPVASPKSKPTEIDDEIQSPPMTTFTPELTPEKRTSKRRAATKIVDFSEEISPKRPRGRPPKAGPTQISPTELKRLNPTDRKYLMMRVKNNEASRRSRLHRKDKEEGLFSKLDELERKNRELHAEDVYLDHQLEMWKKKLFKLYAL